jgi:hypothetical protein
MQRTSLATPRLPCPPSSPVRACWDMALDARWKSTVDDGIANTAWDAYDELLRREIADYNLRLPAISQGYVHVDWKIAKAMLWVESGGPSSRAWTGRVLQIGNPGDPAYKIIQERREGSELIVSDALKRDLGGKIDAPALNIRFALAYLFTRMAMLAFRSIEDPQARTQEYTVVAGDSLQKIAGKVGTTLEALRRMNPTANVLQPRQLLQYRKARMGHQITGWRRFDASTIADRYNGGGDAAYAEKLQYVLALFSTLSR